MAGKFENSDEGRERHDGEHSPVLFALGFAIVSAAVVSSVLPLLPETLRTLAADLSADDIALAVVGVVILAVGVIAWLWWRTLILRAELRALDDHLDQAERRWLQAPSEDAASQDMASLVPAADANAASSTGASSGINHRFIAELSHEFRTPLNGILGMTELLLDTAMTAEQTTYAEAIKTSGETLLSLVEDLLDVSRLEAGKLAPVARPFSLAALVEQVVELLAPRAHAKGIEIASYIDERLPDAVIGDHARLRQVLLNLAGNAVKFTAEGGVTIEVEAGNRLNEVCFAVRDTGVGIAPEDQARIFLEFEQSESEAAQATAGSGLGLAIARRIVQRLGGGLGVDSTPGRGSTFTVTLVLPRADSEAIPFAAPDLAGRALLIVAPAVIEAALLSRRLRRWGAVTRIAPDAAAAQALLSAQRWDGVLVDHALDTNDFDTVRQMLAPSTAHRIVMITPSARHALPSLMEAGFTAWLVKPVRAASLAARLGGEQPRARLERRRSVAGTAMMPAQSRSILIAEDNEINALLTRTAIEKMGHRAVVATDGARAVAAWAAARAAGTPFDLVLMDLHMPGLDGLQAVAQIRGREAKEGAAPTPIVAITANAATDRSTCLAAGLSGILVKPIGREALAAVLAGQFAGSADEVKAASAA